jgi:DNA repair photolyase
LKTEIGTTIETNRHYPTAIQKAPKIMERVVAMENISEKGVETFVTCEPIITYYRF